jgi:hypothetical protein
VYADPPCECEHTNQADFPTEKLLWGFSTKYFDMQFGEQDGRTDRKI